jgi:hypothetical protein
MRSACVLAVLAVVVSSAPAPAIAADPQDIAALAAQAQSVHDQGHALATSLSQATGTNVSPVLAMAAMGGYRWYTTPAASRASLPWHQQPWFWGACALVVAFLTVSTVVPGLRHPAEVVNAQVQQVSSVLTVFLSAAGLATAANDPTQRALAAIGEVLVPSAFAGGSSGAALGGLASVLAWPVAFALGVVVAGAVWLLFQALTVLAFLLSPIGIIGPVAVRLAKLAVLLTLVVATAISPTLGAVVAGVIVALAFLVAGWAFRLVTFGSVLSWDILTFRREKPNATGPVSAFSSRLPGVPRRSWGTLTVNEDGRLAFAWKPWLVLPSRCVPVPSAGVVGVGLLSPVLFAGADLGGVEVARFPPRYRGSQAELAAALGGLPVVDVPLVKGLRAALAWVRGAVAVTASAIPGHRRYGS